VTGSRSAALVPDPRSEAEFAFLLVLAAAAAAIAVDGDPFDVLAGDAKVPLALVGSGMDHALSVAMRRGSA
jgi:hypothetical protein